MGARAGLLTAAAVALLAGCSSGTPAAAPSSPPPSSPPTPVYPPPVSRQPDMLAFGQSTDFRTGLTTSVLELVRVPVNVYPAPTPGAEIPVASTTRVHNDRDTTWAGCGDLYHSLTLPDGQSATPGVSTSLEQGVSTGDVEAGQTATCRHYWLTPASWAGKPIRVKVEVGPDLRSMTWQGTAPS